MMFVTRNLKNKVYHMLLCRYLCYKTQTGNTIGFSLKVLIFLGISLPIHIPPTELAYFRVVNIIVITVDERCLVFKLLHGM